MFRRYQSGQLTYLGTCRLIDKLLLKSKQERDTLDESSATLRSDVNNTSMQNREGANLLLAAADRLRLQLLSRAAALQGLQSTGLLPTVVQLDTEQAPEQPVETATPAKKGKAEKVQAADTAQVLAIELPKALSQEVEAVLSTAQDAMKVLTASYYSKRDSSRVVTRKSIDQDAEVFLASSQSHFTALKEECDAHIVTEQKRFKHQVPPDSVREHPSCIVSPVECFNTLACAPRQTSGCLCRFCMRIGLYLHSQRQCTMVCYNTRRRQ